MAIYHLEAKVISRGAGRSAVAAAAYMSCSKMENEYDGIVHDYTKKKGLVWQQVFLPEHAPKEWKERSVLWNAVEEQEKSKNSRLAREFIVALPVELDIPMWKSLLSDFINKNFVSEGMCVDVAIHNTDGHNPHAHIMTTLRPLDINGKWKSKTEKEYLCKKDGKERGFTATEYKMAHMEGWEKQYPYKVGNKNVYMTSAEGIMQGYERVSKYPKCTKYGRQNATSKRWNSEEQLRSWRENWAEVTNQYLKAYCDKEVVIDHRSHKERGIEEQPTIHEGYYARSLERKGVVSQRCEINRKIKEDNALLKQLKEQIRRILAEIASEQAEPYSFLGTLRKKKQEQRNVKLQKLKEQRKRETNLGKKTEIQR